MAHERRKVDRENEWKKVSVDAMWNNIKAKVEKTKQLCSSQRKLKF